jgi:chemotaxis protein CheC
MAKVSFLKLDLLREIGSIGAGRAATALSELISTRVSITVPDIRLFPFQKVMEMLPNDEYYLLDAALTGDLSGAEYLLLNKNEAKLMGSMLLGINPADVDVNDAMLQSSLCEVANILLSSYMNSLSDLTGFTVIVGVPNFTANIPKIEVEKHLTKHMDTMSEVIYVKSHLTIKDQSFEAPIFFAPAEKALQSLFTKLGLPD